MVYIVKNQLFLIVLPTFMHFNFFFFHNLYFCVFYFVFLIFGDNSNFINFCLVALESCSVILIEYFALFHN